MALKYTSNIPTGPLKVSGGPIDIRTVVQSKTDLMGSDLMKYIGLPVYVIDEKEIYVCYASGRNYTFDQTWKKVGGSDFNAEDYVDYYSQAFGARIVDSVDGLTSSSLLFPYKGMFAVVEDDPASSEDEGGLYVLTKTPHTNPDNWKKVLGSTTNVTNQYFNYTYGGTVDPNNVSDGITIGIDASATVLDYVSASNPIKADSTYTSEGMGSESGETVPEYIKIYPEGSASYIILYGKDSDNWISMNIVDDSLGFGIDDVVVEDGSELVPYTNGEALADGVGVNFGTNLDFTGWVVEDPNGNKSVFGETYGYDVVDIYKESSLPVAFISVNGTSERVLTESDKTDIEDKIADASNNITVEVDKADAGDSDEQKTETVTIQQFVNNITQTVTEIREIGPEEITEEQLNDLF